jgi:hypothetical protein
MKLVTRILAAVLAVAALLAPAQADAARRSRSSKAAAPSFPMKADEYRKFADGRIEKVRGVIEKKLDRRGVSAERKKAINKIFDEVARDVRTEIDKAAADGTVTEAEANKIKTLTTGLRARLRERLRSEKDPKAKEKLAKDDAAKKDKAAKDAKEKDAKKAEPAKPPKEDTKTKTAKAKPAKKAGGPTKPAKASSGKAKKKKPAAAETGADL